MDFWMGGLLKICRLAFVCFIVPFSVDGTSRSPNVVVFFVDDMGYSEPECYGSKDLRTPHIDSLAENGVRCTAGYVSAPSCGPSRAGIMTGHYQTQFGYEANPQKEYRDSFGLDLRYKTLGDRMQAAGYKTARSASGIWGVPWNIIRATADSIFITGTSSVHAITGRWRKAPSMSC